MLFNKTFTKLAPYIILFIPLILVIPGWEGFVYSPRANYSDLAISHYPNALFLIKSLQHGQLPLWSSTILVGYPFAADPLAGIWYLPGWIAYLFPLPLGFNINVFLHLFFNGIGMLFFLRAMGMDEFPSLVGAIAWELAPKIFAHFGSGHLTFVYAIAWTPWLMLAEYKTDCRKSSPWVGIILGSIALADIRWLAYSGFTWFSFSAWLFIKSLQPDHMQRNFLKMAWSRLLDYFRTTLQAMMVAAPLLLPLIEFSLASTRSNLKVDDNLSFALTPVHLFGLLAANFQGYAEWMVYFGGAILLGVIWAICFRGLRKEVMYWLVLMAATLLLSMGGAFPPNYWLARLPGWDLLRVPSRFMLIFGFAGVVILVHFMNMTLEAWKSNSQFWGNLISVGLAAFTWVIAGGLWLVSGQPVWPYVWSAVMISSCVIVFMAFKQGMFSRNFFLIAMLMIVVMDLGTTSHSLFVYRQESQVFSDGEQPARNITDSAGIYRFYSPSYSISQQTAWKYALESIHGIDPLQLSSLIHFLEPAIGIPLTDYYVTVPPFVGDDPKSSNQFSQPNADLLGLLNVKYVLSEFPISGLGLNEWKVEGTTYIYQVENWRTRAWVQPDIENRTTWKPAELSLYSPNQVTINADGPGTLVLSDIDYTGWQVWVDGVPNEMVTIFGLFRGVNLERGSHQINFLFRPVSLQLGLVLAALAWIWLFSKTIIWRKI